MHTALYRKIRPKTFADLVGQPHVVQALANQLETGQLSHAYLFCGTRGTGKTSAAKIFARAVNCEASQESGPCNTCEICQSILAERCMDVVEIDAASNNSVDNIRDLREEVRYPPTQCRYKVYIVDEVHMLSTSAFNALLKTLEEPPSHVIFILATTDPQKIPATILSRCQRYDFKRITAADMIETMQRYLQAEGVSFEDAALERIAYHSDGAMRDALSLLDQCMALGTGIGGTEPAGNAVLTLENVLKLLGAVDRQVLFALTDALAAYDSAKILEIIDITMAEGRDVAQLANDLIRHFRDVLVAGQGAAPDYSGEITDKLKEQGTRLPAQRLIEYIHAFSETLRELRFTPHMRTALEVCALKLCSPAVMAESGSGQAYGGELEGLLSRLAKLERQVEDMAGRAQLPPAPQQLMTDGQASMASSNATCQEDNNTNNQVNTPAGPTQNQTPPTPQAASSGALTPELLATIKSNWKPLCNTLSPMIRSMLIRCGLEADGAMLQIICDNESEVKILKEKNRPLMIREALAERFNLSTPPNLAFIVRDTYNEQGAKTATPVNYEAPQQFVANEAPPPPLFEAPPEESLEQMGWDDFGQGVDADTSNPF